MQRRPEEPVEQRAGAPGLVGLADLSEDLALARNERVEAGGDAEEVQGGRLVAEAVEQRRELRRVGTGEREQPVRLRGVRDREPRAPARYTSVRLHVESTTASHPSASDAGERRGALEIDGDSLAHLDGRAVVRDADEREPHA